nr:hypothetical protein [Streptomyces tsukubensis NRRL18488]
MPTPIYLGACCNQGSRTAVSIRMTANQKPRSAPNERELQLWRVGWALTATFVAALVVAGGIFYGLMTLLDFRGIDRTAKLDAKTLSDLVKLSFGVVAGAGALVALVVAYRRQRVDEAGAHRETTRLHTERFTAAVEQLGSDSPAVRLGGVHALAGLADDAPDDSLRQTCIDVLCAYLQLPFTPDPGEDPNDQEARNHYLALRKVRHTILRLIGDHYRRPRGTHRSWQGHDLDLTDVTIDGDIDFSGAIFAEGTVNFQGAEFAECTVNFNRAVFADGVVNFGRSVFSSGSVTFNSGMFCGALVDFSGAIFAGSTVSFNSSEFSKEMVIFSSCEITGGGINFHHSMFTGGLVDFNSSEFTGGMINFRSTHFNTGELSFDGVSMSGSRVIFNEAEFSGGAVSFRETEFSEGNVDFKRAVFSHGAVNFDDALFTGGRVNFSNAVGEAPQGLLPCTSDRVSVSSAWLPSPP